MSKKIAFMGIFSSLALVAGYLERLIPVTIPVPGIKLGLANVIVLLTIYYMGTKEAFGVMMIKIVVTALLFSGLSGFFYSLSGGLLSFGVMLIGKKSGVFSVIGVSILGGVFHNIGQITLAALIVSNAGLLYYCPVLIIAGIVTGGITGLIAHYVLESIHKIPFNI